MLVVLGIDGFEIWDMTTTQSIEGPAPSYAPRISRALARTHLTTNSEFCNNVHCVVVFQLV
jgi:hypothetical protein